MYKIIFGSTLLERVSTVTMLKRDMILINSLKLRLHTFPNTPMTTKKTEPAPKSIIAWAISIGYRDAPSEILEFSIEQTRSGCIREHEKWMNEPWKTLYREGDRCIRVIVSPKT